MHDVYSFVSGPLVWAAFIVFIGGSVYRIASIALLTRKKDPVVYWYMNPYYALRSIFHWLTPFGTENMRRHPVMTIVAFAFHICLILMPIFLYAHMILFKEAWGVGWWFLSDTTAEVMTLIVIFGCIFFVVRRITQPEVNYLTSASDYVILAIVAAPFVTGFWAYQQWAGAGIVTIIHILSGEIMLVAIPFTRLSHMLFFPFTRGYIGSEFGAVRHAKDW
ncbi:MAG: respiratory nitrate reductase subunit gamma [Deltaproteobacteria bacterium]|nr:respiratory nitrate reductase subunit gamma [Deltaproteobacteria bacterium]